MNPSRSASLPGRIKCIRVCSQEGEPCRLCGPILVQQKVGCSRPGMRLMSVTRAGCATLLETVISADKGGVLTSALLILQVVIALGIVNVWILRFSKTTAWRGSSATNMKEEFQAYGLPPWSVAVIGFLKLACAAALLAGIWFPVVTQPAAIALAVLMLGAILMHLKVKDPPKKSLPAFIMLGLCLIVVFL